MNSNRLLLVGVVFAACLRVGDEGATDAGDGRVRCAFVGGLNETVCVTPPERATCGGQVCELGETCCYPTLKCVAPDAGTCVSPTPGRCASDFECAVDEICHSFGQGCDALGRCEKRGVCEYSGGGDAGVTHCACDGNNYHSLQEACVAGVRGFARSMCGERDYLGFTPCGSNSQCPDGQACCGITGLCFNAAEPWRCERQPDGSLLDCDTDQECIEAAANGGGSGSDDNPYCSRAAGCSGHGTCVRQSFDATVCGGVQAFVCGCDGVTYLNECWAHHASTNVVASGQCP